MKHKCHREVSNDRERSRAARPKASLLLVALLLLCTGVASARPMLLDDLKSITGVSDATISPDGSQIAFIVSRPNYKADRSVRTLMLYNIASRSQRPLTFERKGLASPQWSPDGARLAFLATTGSGKDAQEQLYILDMRGGDAMPITSAPLGIEQFAWRPDSGAIAYVTPDEPKNKKEIAHHLDAIIEGDQDYKADSRPTPSHIWLIGADGKNNVRLTSGDWSLPESNPPSSPASPLSWSPDGRYITFTKNANVFTRGDGDLSVVAILDTQTKAIRNITSHTKFEGYSLFSPDGTKISYWYPYKGDPAGQNDIYVTTPSGGDGSDVTADEIDTNVQRAMWMPDSKSLLISGHKNTDAALWIKPLNGSARRIELGDVQPVQPFWLDASISNTGTIAFTASRPHHPVELYYMSSATSTPQQLTNYNDTVANLDLGRVQPITWQSEGFTEDGMLTFPPNYDPNKAYPLVLVIHGGPNSASIASFSSQAQLLAANGFIVFNPNYRGSDNLGENYWHAIWNDAGAGPGRDVMAGIAAVEKIAKIDTSRMAVSGWSYGGYMTSWMESHYNIWKAAVAGAAVNNWIDEYTLSDNNVGVRYGFNGSPYVGSNMAAYVAQSPITYAWNIHAPTLLLSDVGDVRVPITQTYEMYHALKDHGVTVRFFAYPVSGHSPGDPVRAMDVQRRWIGWLVQYLK